MVTSEPSASAHLLNPGKTRAVVIAKRAVNGAVAALPSIHVERIPDPNGDNDTLAVGTICK
jgi:hypothetical protein